LAKTTKPKATDDDLQHQVEDITVIPDGSMQIDDVVQLGLLNHHTHLLTGEIEYGNVSRAIQWLLYENHQHEKPPHLTLYINSGGGDLYNAFALIDVMLGSEIPIWTVGVGSVMSAAIVILACGAKGHRYLGKHTGVMMHQFTSMLEGKEHEIAASMREMDLCRERVNDLLVKRCKMSDKTVREKLLHPSDVWLTAQEAIQYHFADKLLNTLF
jgi:ATP-dependent Clp protease protease subunit